MKGRGTTRPARIPATGRAGACYVALIVYAGLSIACSGDTAVNPVQPPHTTPVSTRVANQYGATFIPVPTGHAAVATSISDVNTVAGWEVTTHPDCNSLFNPYCNTPLDASPVTYSSSGYSIYPCHAFVWSAADGYRQLSAAADTGSSATLYATAINSAGVVVGARADLDSTALPNGIRERPVRWSAAGVLQVLPSPGDPRTRAIDMDENGAILVVAPMSNQAWVWREGSGYTQVSPGGNDAFIALRLTSDGVAGISGTDFSPLILTSSGFIRPVSSGEDCVGFGYAHSGATIASCATGSQGQWYVWASPSAAPTAAVSDSGRINLRVVSNGGVAFGYARNSLAGIAYDPISGVVPLAPRIASGADVGGGSPIAVNASGTLLFPGASRRPNAPPAILVPSP